MAHFKKKGLCLLRVQRKLISADPQRPAILARVRWTWCHLPDEDVLLFFDMQPIVVKAYGGRRYTSAKRLVLEKQQNPGPLLSVPPI